MDKKIIFVKTKKGEDETQSKTNHLYGDLKRVLGLVDNKSTVAELTKRAAPSLRDSFEDMLQKLVEDGFIQDQEKTSSVLKMATPKMAEPASPENNAAQALDFTIGKPGLAASAPVSKEQPGRAAEEANKARTQAEAALQRAEREAARIRVEIAAAQAKAKQEVETQMRTEAEAAQRKAEQQSAQTQVELAALQAHMEERVKQEVAAKIHAETEAARLKAEQQSAQSQAELAALQAQIKQAAEAKMHAEAEVARLKAEQEQAQRQAELAARQAQEKLEAEIKVRARAAEAEAARLKYQAEEEVRKLAEAQAKAWADAEQRAREQGAAPASPGSGAQMAVPPIQPVTVQAVPRIVKSRRNPLPWGKVGAALLVLLLISAFLLPYVWPMQEYVAEIEQKLSRQLRQPVRIGQLQIKLLPWPEMSLQDVFVGTGQQLKAGNVVLEFGMLTLFSEEKTIKTVVIDNLALDASSFEQTLPWLQRAAGIVRYPVERMVLQRAQISNTGLGLPSLNGTVDFRRGQIIKAVLNADDGKLSVLLQPQQSRWQIEVMLRDNPLPLLPDTLFSELNLKGEIDAGTVYFNEVSGQLYEGQVAGSGRLTWQNGWQIKGRLNIKNMELEKILPLYGIAGKLEGNTNFTLQGMKPALLTKDIRVDGNLIIKQGVINKIDIVETARWTNQMSTAGSRTHFDELSTAFWSDTGGQHFRQIKIAAGIMNAEGSMDVTPGKQLSGQLNVDLKTRAKMGSVPLLLSGTLTNPVLKIQ